MWPIIQEWPTSKKKLNYRDRLDQVLTLTKIGQDNNMINRIDMVYVESNAKLP